MSDALKLPPYLRPFGPQEPFLGYFRWGPALTEARGPYARVYHGCHEDELMQALDEGVLGLKSVWAVERPGSAAINRNGVWASFNHYGNSPNGNLYGPFLLAFPLSVLHGRRFGIVRRVDQNRTRHVFVQHEEEKPLFHHEGAEWPEADPLAFWAGVDPAAITDLVLTQSVPMEEVRVTGIDHRSCVMKKCDRPYGQGHGWRVLLAIAIPQVQQFLMTVPDYVECRVAINQVSELLLASQWYQRFARRFPYIEDETLPLPGPLEGESVLLPALAHA